MAVKNFRFLRNLNAVAISCSLRSLADADADPGHLHQPG
jgi:hypothetical protein